MAPETEAMLYTKPEVAGHCVAVPDIEPGWVGVDRTSIVVELFAEIVLKQPESSVPFPPELNLVIVIVVLPKLAKEDVVKEPDPFAVEPVPFETTNVAVKLLPVLLPDKL